MSVIILKNINHISSEVKKNTPVIIYKNFLKKKTCKKIIDICHRNFLLKYHRKNSKNKFINFASIDVLPSSVKTNRIFRIFDMSDYFISKFPEL